MVPGGEASGLVAPIMVRPALQGGIKTSPSGMRWRRSTHVQAGFRVDNCAAVVTGGGGSGTIAGPRAEGPHRSSPRPCPQTPGPVLHAVGGSCEQRHALVRARWEQPADMLSGACWLPVAILHALFPSAAFADLWLRLFTHTGLPPLHRWSGSRRALGRTACHHARPACALATNRPKLRCRLQAGHQVGRTCHVMLPQQHRQELL